MDDREIVRRCAEAMAYDMKLLADMEAGPTGFRYDPLTNDAQAMALVREFRMTIVSMDYGEKWHAIIPSAEFNCDAICPDLNRAICIAVAAMQEAKGG